MTTISSIVLACKKIAAIVRTSAIEGLTGLADSEANSSGDQVKKLDLIANEIFCKAVKGAGHAAIMVSEEEDNPVAVEAVGGGKYIACFDPIDGSSNLDAAVTTGSIFGIYRAGESCTVDLEGEDVISKCIVSACQAGDGERLARLRRLPCMRHRCSEAERAPACLQPSPFRPLSCPLAEMAAAGYVMFSSSVILVLTVGKGVYGFTLDPLHGEVRCGGRIFGGRALMLSKSLIVAQRLLGVLCSEKYRE